MAAHYLPPLIYFLFLVRLSSGCLCVFYGCVSVSLFFSVRKETSRRLVFLFPVTDHRTRGVSLLSNNIRWAFFAIVFNQLPTGNDGAIVGSPNALEGAVCI